MGRNKCRSCGLNNRDLSEFCWNLEDALQNYAKSAFELELYAQSIGAKRAVMQFRDIGMLLSRTLVLADLLEQEKYKGRNARKRRRSKA